MELFRQQYWSGLPFPPPGDLPNPGIKPAYFTYVNMLACDSSRISHLQRPHTQVDALCPPCGCAPWLWIWQTPHVSAPSNDCRTELWGGDREEGKGKEGEELSSSSFKKYFPFVHFQNLVNNIYWFFHLLLFTPSTFSIKALLRYSLYIIKFTIERWMGLWAFFSDLFIIFGCAGPRCCAGFSLAAVRRATP